MRPPSLLLRSRRLIPFHPNFSLRQPISTTTTTTTIRHDQDELAFSNVEMLQTIRAMRGQDDEKGARRLEFVSYTKGNPMTVTTSDLSKAELCAKYQIHPRNLGIVDMAQALNIGQYATKTSSEAVIVPLKQVILVNLLYVKALITDDQVLLFSPVPPSLSPPHHSPNPTQIDPVRTNDQDEPGHARITTRPALQRELEIDPIEGAGGGEGGSEGLLYDVFGRYLEQRLSKDSTDPFEHRALESLLTSLASIFEAELALLISRTDALVHDLAEDITREELNRLLGLRGAVGECLGRTVGIRRAVDRLLSEDADLAAAYLTAKATNTPRTTADHEELELLLENYSQRFEGIITGVNGALARIKSNQEVVELSLASTRNKLLLLDLKMSLCTVGLTLGAFGAGLLGMNLTNHFEDDPTAFYEVSAGLILLTSVVGGLGIRALRKISRAGLGSLARIATRR